MTKPTIVVWFSCGAASAVAAKTTIEDYGDEYNIRIVNNPIHEEDPDNIRFRFDIAAWLGRPVEIARNPAYLDCSTVQVWDDFNFMSGPTGARCTLELKKKARQHWENENEFDYLVLGFTADEKKRADQFKRLERDNLLTPLIDRHITKQDCFDILVKAGIRLPRMYHLGYPNANCVGCVKATSPTYWNHVRHTHPEVFADRAEQSRRIGARLVRVKGERIFLDQLDPEVRGRAMKEYVIECGIFCEEPT